MFAPDGRITRLTVGAHNAIVPMKDGKGGGYFQERGRLIPLGRPRLQPDGSIASRSEGAALLWKFTSDAIRIYAVAISPFGGEFIMQVPDDAERIIDARTGREAREIYEKGSPQIFFADGANMLCDDENQYGGKYGVRLTTRGVPDGPRFVGFWFNWANPWHKRLVLHAKPRPSDAIEISVESPRADFIFPAGLPAQLDFPARMRYGMTFEGQAVLSCDQMYPDPPAARALKGKTIRLTSETKLVSWSVNLPKPGLYQTTLAIYDGKSVVRGMSTNICYGMDGIGGPAKPDDFDAFWKETKAKIAAMPLEFEKKQIHEDDKTTLYVISYEAIDGKPGWAYLRVPKKEGRFPAVMMLPPVASRASGGYGYGDRVEMGVEVRGYDLTLSEHEGKKNPAIKYDPGSVAAGTKREDTWLYYAYCTMMRAYDILESLPEVDKKRIYTTGVSQGGGLCLALASLRPQNAGVLSIVGGLCRLDWRTGNLGGWGPGAPEGPDRERILKDLSYFDACNLVPYIRSRAVVAIGLLDDHTPPHAAANAYYQLEEGLREKRLISNPWMGHSGWPELDKIIPRWMAEDDPDRQSRKTDKEY
jgi:cephalosporin-C deacetylase